MIENSANMRRDDGGSNAHNAGFSRIIVVTVAIAIIFNNNISAIRTVEAFHPTPFSRRAQQRRIRHSREHSRPVSSSSITNIQQQAPFISSSPKLSLSINAGIQNNNRNETCDMTTKTTAQPPKYDISLLLIDHYDSFTYNLYDMLAQLTVRPPMVVTKDAFDGWDEEQLSHIDGIVLSPGPGSPQEQPEFSKQAILRNPHRPILGVCLGHQLLALEYGAKVDKAPVPIHGQDHWIRTCFYESNVSKYPSILNKLPPSFRAVRYHSLAAYEIPSAIKVTATSADDNVIQGLQHVEYPHYGVQFHPESIGTQHGMDLLKNFCQIVATEKIKNTQETCESAAISQNVVDHQDSTGGNPSQSTPKFRVYVHAVKSPQPSTRTMEDSPASLMEPVDAFQAFYGQEPRAIWLDSSSASTSGRGTLDIMAAPLSPEDIVEHYVHQNGKDILTRLEERLFRKDVDHSALTDRQHLHVVDSDFETVRIKVDDLREMPNPNLSNDDDQLWEHLPFEYRGGYLGFLGYEIRHETQRFLQQLDKGTRFDSSKRKTSPVPDSVFFLARQSMVYHHPTQTWYLIALIEEDDEIASALKWMQETARGLTNNEHDKSRPVTAEIVDISQAEHQQEPLKFVPNRSKAKYQQDIAHCHEFIRMGESYELCLTNQLEAEVPEALSTWKLYQTLRIRNPAPYSAYFRWNIDHQDSSTSPASFAICSSSPERFMSVKRTKRHPLGSISLQAEAKPIKGTCARVEPQNGICLSDSERREDERRARSLELSLKNRAENLMIVDLLRNDMSRVCEIGSVHVAKLMAIESFATVHQMVSTIRGTLSQSENTLDLLRASFPGGSMTGAPKVRTLELLEELEDSVDRGPYAGSLGYLSVNGSMDMNIIIRSAVVTSNENGGQKISIGAGGAITALSEMEDEYEEMLLKARAVVEAVQTWASRGSSHQIAQTLKVESTVKD